MPSDKRARQRAGRAARLAELQQAHRRRQRIRRGVIVAVIVAIAIGLAVYTSTSGGSNKTSTSGTTSTAASSPTSAAPTTAATATPPTAAPVTGAGKLTGATPCPKLDGSSPHITTFAQAPPNCLQAGKKYTATFVTNMGNVVVALDTTKTPMTANNFVVLSLYHFYDGTAMFRTDTSIDIIQGGSPHTQSAADPGPGYTIKDEGSGFTYVPGDLTMARTSSPNSAGAQYFFCAGTACSQLNSQGTYVNFGKVTSGLDVLEKILASNVDTAGGLGGAPKQLVTVQKVTITQS